MALSVVYDRDQRLAAIICTTTGLPLGIVVRDEDSYEGHESGSRTADEMAEDFIQWALDKGASLRSMTTREVQERFQDFLKDHTARRADRITA